MKLSKSDISPFKQPRMWIKSKIAQKICKYAFTKSETGVLSDILIQTNITIWSLMVSIIETNFLEYIQNNTYYNLEDKFYK